MLFFLRKKHREYGVYVVARRAAFESFVDRLHMVQTVSREVLPAYDVAQVAIPELRMRMFENDGVEIDDKTTVANYMSACMETAKIPLESVVGMEKSLLDDTFNDLVKKLTDKDAGARKLLQEDFELVQYYEKRGDDMPPFFQWLVLKDDSAAT